MTGSLLDSRLIADLLTREAPWRESHGADGTHLGMGLLYYSLTYALRADVAVCLGSGGGFVPRLMRQAQRDLGIADETRTILVDGNVPEGGWGHPLWLDDDSFFRREYPDVEIVLQRTDEAAESFFAPQALRIRYLHVDADHSLEGALGDFLCYRPFLETGSVVTLHDTSLPGAGVRHVVEHLRARADCEVVDFPEVGFGTAVVRITSDRPPREAPRVPTDRSSAVDVTRKRGAVTLDPPLTQWRYLRSEAFCTRQALAAHFVRDCPTVVELGAWHTPIDRYLTGPHTSVLVVDPFIRDSERTDPNGGRCRVRHVRARFQDLSWRIVRPQEYGLVILGLDFDLSEADEPLLFELVDGARVTVIEFAASWELARRQYARIRASTHVKEILRLGLDLGGNDLGDLANSWPPRVERELHVLAPAEAAPRRPVGSSWATAAEWQAHGGDWQFEPPEARVRADGEEWVELERDAGLPAVPEGKNLLVEVAVAGEGEAAGISFGAYRDFLVPPAEVPRRVQVEIDPLRGAWAHRVDGRPCPSAWWNEGVGSVHDLLGGRLTLKARFPKDVTFSDLAVREVDAGRRVSVVLTCSRFLQRLRLALRNWCAQDLPAGTLELLVVNPESPDGTADYVAVVARSSRHVSVREVRVPAALATNKGAMINKALEVVAGDWIWIADADCLFPAGTAREALRQAEAEPRHLYFLRRRYLSESQTDALLTGTLDPVRDLEELATAAAGARDDHEAPWGYSQLVPRDVLERVRYRDDVNNFTSTDESFAQDCRRNGYPPLALNGLFCLHLHHPFAWDGTDAFL
jgi:Glycosyltransferase like family 2